MTASLEDFVHAPWRAEGANVVDRKGNLVCECVESDGTGQILAIFIAGLPELHEAACAIYETAPTLDETLSRQLFQAIDKCSGGESRTPTTPSADERLLNVHEFFRHWNPIDPSVMFDDTRTMKQAVAEYLDAVKGTAVSQRQKTT